MQLNTREAKVLKVILQAKEPVSIREVARIAFPSIAPVTKADSWVRNSVRRATVAGWVRRAGIGSKPGCYKIDGRSIEKIKAAIANPREPRRATKTISARKPEKTKNKASTVKAKTVETKSKTRTPAKKAKTVETKPKTRTSAKKAKTVETKPKTRTSAKKAKTVENPETLRIEETPVLANNGISVPPLPDLPDAPPPVS